MRSPYRQVAASDALNALPLCTRGERSGIRDIRRDTMLAFIFRLLRVGFELGARVSQRSERWIASFPATC
jgi:hypothetical protein